MSEKVVADILEIRKVIPHRYPFLLVDKIVELVDNEYCVGIKCVTFNEPQFTGHFPEYPIMPGVMLIEAMMQTASLMALIPMSRSGRGVQTDKVYFLSLSEAKFRKPVVPGDVMRIVAKRLRIRGRVGRFNGKIFVDGHLCAEACFTILMP